MKLTNTNTGTPSCIFALLMDSRMSWASDPLPSHFHIKQMSCLDLHHILILQSTSVQDGRRTNSIDLISPLSARSHLRKVSDEQLSKYSQTAISIQAPAPCTTNRIQIWQILPDLVQELPTPTTLSFWQPAINIHKQWSHFLKQGGHERPLWIFGSYLSFFFSTF